MTAEKKSLEAGKIGQDAFGTRFIVLRPGFTKGSEVGDDPYHVAVLPGPKFLPGQVLHVSWLELPITWEES